MNREWNCFSFPFFLAFPSRPSDFSGANGRTFGRDGLVAGGDLGHGAPGTARLALQKDHPGLVVLLQQRLRGATRVTGDVLFDVATQDILNLLLLETALDDQLVVSVHRTSGTCSEEGRRRTLTFV